MGIDDNIRGDPLTGEWHVLCEERQSMAQARFGCHNHGNQIKPHLLSVSDSTGSLLPMAASELVSDLRDPHRANLDLAELVAILVYGHHYLIKETVTHPLTTLQGHTHPPLAHTSDLVNVCPHLRPVRPCKKIMGFAGILRVNYSLKSKGLTMLENYMGYFGILRVNHARKLQG